MRDTDQATLTQALSQIAGLNAASTADWRGAAISAEEIGNANALIFEHIGVAVVDVDPSQLSALESAVADNSNPILAVEPEEYVQVLEEDEVRSVTESLVSAAGMHYLIGYQQAVSALVSALSGMEGPAEAELDLDIESTYSDTDRLTWGLQATRASLSACGARGIRIAVLDTGFDLAHPDFVGRSPITASFVPGQTVQDGHGHGTHCIGTSCGPRVPAGTKRRYGIGCDATILAGKVLNNSGSGVDSWILAGINWALQNKAVVISMSLGAPVAAGQSYKLAYEQAGQAALNAGCLIVAAAGNSGNQPVGSPANCPSFMAVAALNSSLQRAPFSCIAINPNGGEVDIAGPGVDVFSSTKMPAQYATWSGTSMATPHVAGCAALWAQNSGLRGKPLWNKLTSTARNIGLAAQFAGAGLVQAPLCRRPILPPHRLPIDFPIRWPRPFPGPTPH
jgi:subtilisin family serine protease